ncbi:obscurin-like isoform X1 [Gambusia affinis]|uniref:obscurin-like isoform X1 n=1 Tax=Gambusia affinis TaxID=33528 RepID=UPI001CDC54F2|nr:obscurin-like isoform X1 [Gambusia affinis]
MGHAWLYVLFLFGSVISGFAQVSNRATVTLSSNWPLIYKGENIYLRCEIPGGEGIRWTYEWRPTRLNEAQTSKEHFFVHSAGESDSGGYSCRGRSEKGSTDWSDVVVLTVYQLSVFPSWLSPGASVTLSCEVEHPPAGTRFFWYKAVYNPSSRFYSYELLPGSSDGTEENFYIVHGLSNTAGYVCEAGNGKPEYRDPSFVWSADPRPAASLSVNPDRVQHFSSDSVSLSCEGNSDEWRVMRITERGHLLDCSSWGKMTGSTCTIKPFLLNSGVFWCESGSGEFSNAVNVTVQDSLFLNTILVSPVHPVTEGDPVTLSCRDKNQNLLSNVFFYHNDKLIQNDSREELNISAVSKSDEGFYKCQHSGRESPSSWMSVRVTESSPVSSSFPVMIVGPVVGVVLFILVILLLSWWRCSRSKNSWCIRSEGSSQSSSTNQEPNQRESQVYSSLLHGDTSEYETIQPTSSNRRPVNPEDNHIYTNMTNRQHRIQKESL